MRTPRELAFRSRQELANGLLWLTQPAFTAGNGYRPLDLPPPAAAVAHVRRTPFGSHIDRKADELLTHHFAFLGHRFDAGEEISWRRDYKNGITSADRYFRFIPYLDAAKVGDHKFIWELNRHQHLVLLAQAQLITNESKYLVEIERQLESWIRHNRFMCGINWCSALEVGFRALSWLWVYHFVGDQLHVSVRRRLVNEIYRSGLYLEHNLSVYFSPNTHLLGEAVALHAIGRLLPWIPASRRWREAGERVVSREMDRQVREDGTHFEQSSYYHVYALDMFLFHHLLADASAEYVARLGRMADYLHALMGQRRTLPLIGDDDGGRFFHPYGRVDEFGRGTLATCAIVLDGHWPYDTEDLEPQALWWLGSKALQPSRVGTAAAPSPSRIFRDSGVAVLQSSSVQVIFDCGPLGRAAGGHSHADSLSLVIRTGDEELVVDPGTYTYVGSERERNWFRGTGAHSTMRIDERDHAVPAGPFRWTDKPHVEVGVVSLGENQDVVTGSCVYRIEGAAGLVHRRSVLLVKSWPGFGDHPLLVVCDVVDRQAGVHRLEQLWHLGSPPVLLATNHAAIGAAAHLLVTGGANLDIVDSWRSAAFGEKSLSKMLVSRRETALPAEMWAVVLFGDASGAMFQTTADREVTLRFGEAHVVFRNDEHAGLSYRVTSAKSTRYRGEE